MRIIAYCMQSVARVVRRGAGVYPVSCPPFDQSTFGARVLEQADFIWLGLHGVAQSPEYLYGDEVPADPFPLRIEALSVKDILSLNLPGRIVFASTCDLPETGFPEAFKQVGATIVGGPGNNYGSRTRLVGADKLGYLFLRQLLQGEKDVERALETAKRGLGESPPDMDAREFSVL